MTRHLADHPRAADTGRRLGEYLRIERDGLPNPATVALQRGQERDLPADRRVAEFLRIDRGYHA